MAPPRPAPYAATQRDPACTGAENHEDGVPTSKDVVGADEAFSIGYADPNDGHGRDGGPHWRTLVLASATFHFGVVTGDGVYSDDLAARSVDRLEECARNPGCTMVIAPDGTGVNVNNPVSPGGSPPPDRSASRWGAAVTP